MAHRLLRVVALLAVLGVVVALGIKVFGPDNGTTELTVDFTRSTGLYSGDDVRVLGVKVGQVESINPDRDGVRVKISLDDGIAVPPGAEAAIVAPNLVTSRFVQITPAWVSGPKMPAGATIPVSRTAVPIEWDEVKTQLTRLAGSLAPTTTDEKGALGGAVGTADANLTGTAQQLHTMLGQLSRASGTLASNRGDLFGTVRGLASFVQNLVRSDKSVRSFSQQLADVSNLLDDNKSQLGAALSQLDDAMGKVTSFVKDNRTSLRTSIKSLSTLTTTLAGKQYQLAELLHVAPTALDNFYNIVDPRYHAATGTIAAGNFGDVAQLVCRAIVATGGGPDACLAVLGPLLKQLGLSTIPLSVKDAVTKTAAEAGKNPAPATIGIPPAAGVPGSNPVPNLLGLL
ncbi:MAG: MCE family protein, partial [Actinomycetota bacterium]|nr:MCE family protein [Actinomycetota bacterium]